MRTSNFSFLQLVNYLYSKPVKGLQGYGVCYRFAFNGKELDNESQTQDYGMRIYDLRISKFLSVDPLTKDYPFLTPYQFAANIPIKFIDIDGMECGEPGNNSFKAALSLTNNKTLEFERNLNNPCKEMTPTQEQAKTGTSNIFFGGIQVFGGVAATFATGGTAGVFGAIGITTGLTQIDVGMAQLTDVAANGNKFKLKSDAGSLAEFAGEQKGKQNGNEEEAQLLGAYFDLGLSLGGNIATAKVPFSGLKTIQEGIKTKNKINVAVGAADLIGDVQTSKAVVQSSIDAAKVSGRIIPQMNSKPLPKAKQKQATWPTSLNNYL